MDIDSLEVDELDEQLNDLEEIANNEHEQATDEHDGSQALKTKSPLVARLQKWKAIGRLQQKISDENTLSSLNT